MMHRLPRFLLACGLLSILPSAPADEPAPASPTAVRIDSTGQATSDGPGDGAADPPRAANSDVVEPAGKPTEAERRLLAFLDGDGDAVLSPAEFERFPTPMRRWLEAEKARPAEAVEIEDFTATLRRMLEDLRAGRHSVAAVRRAGDRTASAANVANADTPGNSGNGNGAGAARSSESPGATSVKVDTSDPFGPGAQGAYSFGRMDQNPRDGKLQLEEWSGEMKSFFEENGVTVPREMDKETFLQHYVRLRM